MQSHDIPRYKACAYYIDREQVRGWEDTSRKLLAFGIITATLFRHRRGYTAGVGVETAYV